MQCHWWSSDKRIENYICRTKNWFNKQSKRYPHISHILNRGPKIFTDRIFFVKMSHWVNGFYYIPLAKSNMSIIIFFIHKHGDSGWLVVHTWTCKTLDRMTELRRNSMTEGMVRDILGGHFINTSISWHFRLSFGNIL